MRSSVRVLVVGLALVLGPVVAGAADVARLEWGSYVVEDDSSVGFLDWKSVSSDDGNSIRVTFRTLEAKADGGTVESKSHVSGHFDLVQPEHDSFTRLRVELKGHVIKSPASLTRLAVTVGNSEQTIEWPAGTPASEAFTREIEIPLQTTSLPTPFRLSARLYARKDGTSDAAYVSLDSLVVTAENPQVAAR